MPEQRSDHPRLYLAAKDGKRPPSGQIPMPETPEDVLDVTFVGITEAEQRAALAAFPGGKRFRLKLVSGG